MIQSTRVVITKPRGRLETRTGVLYGPELNQILTDCYFDNQHAVAYAHNHPSGRPLVVGESDPPNRVLWCRAAPPLSDNGDALAYGPSHA